MLEEPRLRVLVFAWRLRIVRGEDRSQIVPLQWRWQDESSVRTEVCRCFHTRQPLVETTDRRDNEAALE